MDSNNNNKNNDEIIKVVTNIRMATESSQFDDGMFESTFESPEDGSAGGSGSGNGGGGSSSKGNMDSGATTSSNNSSNNNDEYKEMAEYAKKETRNVLRARRLVIVCIIAIGALVSVLAYYVLSQQVKQDAIDAFGLFANTIEENFRFKVSSIFQANRALARTIISSALTANKVLEFPYFQVPAFEQHAYEARVLGGFETLTYAPVANKLEKWLNFSQSTRTWIDESKRIYDDLQPGMDRSLEPPTLNLLPNAVWKYPDGGNDGEAEFEQLTRNGIFAPSFQTSPPPLASVPIYQNVDLLSNQDYRDVSLAAVELQDAVLSPFRDSFVKWVDDMIGEEAHQQLHDAFHNQHGEAYDRVHYQVQPHSVSAQPVYNTLSTDSHGSFGTVIGYIFGVVAWDNYLMNLLPEGIEGIIVVLSNSCGQAESFELVGNEAVYLGSGDFHDTEYDLLSRTIRFSENYLEPERASEIENNCEIFLDIYSSSKFEQQYSSYIPFVFTGLVAFLFVIMASTFVLYDKFVQNRNTKVVNAAVRSNAIISSMFPKNVKKQLMADHEKENNSGDNKKRNLKGFLTGNAPNDLTDQAGGGDAYGGAVQQISGQPIADFIPEASVLFADIAGFTAWSSAREPAQVFTLLETIYSSFDAIAKRRRVYKVETVGDCYVAVTGLPEPRKDHAVLLARFASECMVTMDVVTRSLEVSLGPDTCDLGMRMGIHSGPVIAGVLRGERSRFQLFGDTMNTAARMESNGLKGRIQISQGTMEQLAKFGKNRWVTSREDVIHAKGKGELQTYWLQIREKRASSTASSSNDQDVDEIVEIQDGSSKSTRVVSMMPAFDEEKRHRLVDWNVDVMKRLLEEIIARRNARNSSNIQKKSTPKLSDAEEAIFQSEPGRAVIDEVEEIIKLPHFDAKLARKEQDADSISLDPTVVSQLYEFVQVVSETYRENPFHNFEHASHVTMSVTKLLKRIVAPSDLLQDDDIDADANVLHDNTYGITSDPLTQFSCVFAALIHDLDHPGVPNSQLVNEGDPIAKMYKNQSVAEQNSVDIAFDMLSLDNYAALRACIYSDATEMMRFRQLVVNSVMATDIVDKKLKQLRNARWDKAFAKNDQNSEEEHPQNIINRKATIVIEHLIQASDVAHTMQHWHVYRKWNERFFMECYKAYKEGRADKDPSISWYNGEMGFFDYYIIPLAKKLKDCGVFGVSSDEYLSYATMNRKEWETKGQKVVEEMIEKADRLFPNQA